MEFIDEVVIFVASGNGGSGAATFLRERFRPRGGPDGGDGGRGGRVIFEATRARNTLVDYQRERKQVAEPGQNGMKRQMNGASGKDKYIPVPVGTVVINAETDELMADLDTEGETFVLEGGRGGKGNMHFKTSTNRTPRYAQPGEEGWSGYVRLELKLLADVGLLGFPNAGKSTFLGRVSAAKPRVANYPFTTLTPNLGVVKLAEGKSFVIADIPGLIEGAAEGLGLGHRFLKHVERCACYVHLVSAETWEDQPAERFVKLNEELRRYDDSLSQRPQFVVLNKIDLLDPAAQEELVAELKAASGAKVFPISAATGKGVQPLIHAVWGVLTAASEQPDQVPGHSETRWDE